MSQQAEAPLIVAFVSDLIFTTKIRNVVRGLGYRIEWLGHASDLEGEDVGGEDVPGEQLQGKSGRLFDLITRFQPALLLFDLSNTDVPWRRWIPSFRSSPATRRIPILAFGPHTNVEMMQEAKRVGADTVLARSRFTADMPNLLQQYVRIHDHDSVQNACLESLAPLARRGIQEFNRGQFYACHDDLEEAWRQDDGAARDLYRGILQVGIAYYQIERENYRGAAKMLLRVRQWLDPLPDTCRGVNVAQLRKDAATVYEALVEMGPERIAEFDRSFFKPVLVSGD